jgi:hypothetical protein
MKFFDAIQMTPQQYYGILVGMTILYMMIRLIVRLIVNRAYTRMKNAVSIVLWNNNLIRKV